MNDMNVIVEVIRKVVSSAIFQSMNQLSESSKYLGRHALELYCQNLKKVSQSIVDCISYLVSKNFAS